MEASTEQAPPRPASAAVPAPRARARRPSRVTSAALLAVACLCLYVGLNNLGPALRAATASGVAGTFTAERLDCVRHPGHETCTWSGRFRAVDGPAERPGVALYGSGRGALRAGQSVPALDVGNAGRVYRPQGSREWIFTLALVVAGYGLLVQLARRHLVPPRTV